MPSLSEWSFYDSTRISFITKKQLPKTSATFCKTSTGQNALFFIDPTLWNKVHKEIKRTTDLNAFKHNLKKHYLKENGKANA